MFSFVFPGNPIVVSPILVLYLSLSKNELPKSTFCTESFNSELIVVPYDVFCEIWGINAIFSVDSMPHPDYLEL
jgi:hypothetical protein